MIPTSVGGASAAAGPSTAGQQKTSHPLMAMLVIEKGYERTSAGVQTLESNICQCVQVMLQGVRAAASEIMYRGVVHGGSITIGQVTVAPMDRTAIRMLLESTATHMSFEDKIQGWTIDACCIISA